MFVVAILHLATPLAREAEALAARFGTHAYDERQKLAAGLPAIVVSTPDPARADAVLRDVRSRGHGALGCTLAEVVASTAMTSLRRFALDADALVADQRLPWAAVTALVRATHRLQAETVDQRREKKFDLARTVASGGLVTHKVTTRDVVTRSLELEPVLYVHRRGGPPWLLREQGTQYAGLGATVTTSAQRNFMLTVEQLRARAPHARFDDRLVARKTSPADADLLSHLVATWLMASGA